MTSESEGRLGAELEEALTHAERVLAALDRTESSIRTMGLAMVALLFGALAIGALLLTSAAGTVIAATGLAVALLAALGVGAALVLRNLRALVEQRSRDLALIVQLSRIVRDLLPVAVEKERWSELRHVTTRARISRFPISDRSR